MATRRPLALAAAVGAAWLGARALVRHGRRTSFRGQVALVTGGSRGLGLELARQLVDEGARVAILARDPETLARARAELLARAAARGLTERDVVSVPCDVGDSAQVCDAITVVRETLGEVDLLINDAGIIQVGPAEQMTLAEYEEALRVNYYGTLHTILAVAPRMQARRSGRIVNVTSIGGKVPIGHLLPYTASKFAAVGLSEGLRTVLAKDDVWVTTVCPGELRTGSPAHAVFKGDAAAEYAWFAASDSAPVLSMAVERAAAKILDAARHGDAELVMPASAWLQARLHGIAPALSMALGALAEARLPGPVPGGEARRAGHEVEGREPGWAREAQHRARERFQHGEGAAHAGDASAPA
jgi:NAD(P)-dependent dehydrogenase (short-subunit alcohol dehydrogenase family)